MYPELGYEFLSTLEVIDIADDPLEIAQVKFCLLGDDHSMNYGELTEVFRFNSNAVSTVPEHWPEYEAWRERSSLGTPYDPSRSKATGLRSPILRLIHCMLARSVQGRGDSTGVVRATECSSLWNMMHGNSVKARDF